MAIRVEGVGDCPVERGCGDSEPGREFGAVDDEGLGELVLHLEELADGGVGQGEGAQQHGRDRAELGPVPSGELVDRLDEAPGGAGARVVGQVPDLAGGVGFSPRTARPSPMSGM